jgi:hypothetical protein
MIDLEKGAKIWKYVNKGTKIAFKS